MEDPRFGNALLVEGGHFHALEDIISAFMEPAPLQPTDSETLSQWHTVRRRPGNDVWSHLQRPEVRSVQGSRACEGSCCVTMS